MLIAAIIIEIIIAIIGLIFIGMAIHDEEYYAIVLIAFLLIFIEIVILLPFVALDKSSGTTIGTITTVDKQFFGTTKLYIKTTEQHEDKYCIEDEAIINQAKELIGKKVQLYYGERVGIYPLSKCRTAPIDKIERIDGESDE